MQRHLGGDVGQPFRHEIRGARAGLDHAEGVLDRPSRALSAWRRDWRRAVAGPLDEMLVLPAGDPALLGRRALPLDRACCASWGRPVAPQRHAVLDVAEVVCQQRSGWAAIGVLIGKIGKVLLAEPSVAGRSSASTNARSHERGLSSPIQSSRHSGRKVIWDRSAPTTKRPIPSPFNRENCS